VSKQTVHLLIIDPQSDFMDSPGAALPVPGANADMRRLARLIGRVGRSLSAVHVTLDTHAVIDVAHPGMWRGRDGKPPDPFTVISADDVAGGVWRPRAGGDMPPELGGMSVDA
jgi:nicotinamidase/pyrazinamidase